MSNSEQMRAGEYSAQTRGLKRTVLLGGALVLTAAGATVGTEAGNAAQAASKTTSSSRTFDGGRSPVLNCNAPDSPQTMIRPSEGRLDWHSIKVIPGSKEVFVSVIPDGGTKDSILVGLPDGKVASVGKPGQAAVLGFAGRGPDTVSSTGRLQAVCAAPGHGAELIWNGLERQARAGGKGLVVNRNFGMNNRPLKRP